MNFYDSVSESNISAKSVVLQIRSLIDALREYSNKTSSFVPYSYSNARNLTITMSDMIDTLCSFRYPPHALVRSFRNILCGFKALPSAVFKGFTNPDLFDGASNCGTTLGVLPASVADTNNSFTATAQLPIERFSMQSFSVPQTSLLIREEPTRVSGVYLSTDIARLGLNYLKSYSGRTVFLTSVPNDAVVIDYYVKSSSVQNTIRLYAAVGRTVKSDDNLERIALDVYGKASQWKLIALYNELEYPFFVSEEFEKEVKATGFVRFYRNLSYLPDIVITVGREVWVPEFQGTRQIDFKTTATTTLSIGKEYVDVPVRAVLSGEIGNVGVGSIVGIDSDLTGKITKISNISNTSGGKNWKVAKPGDIIMVPKTESMTVSTVVNAKKDYEALFGIDLYIKDGELDSSSEQGLDLKRTFGIHNLVQALGNRIVTNKRFYTYHPEYGTYLYAYIGKKSSKTWQDVIKVDIKDACLLDPRIASIKSFLMEISGDMIGLSFDAIPVNQSSSVPVSLVV